MHHGASNLELIYCTALVYSFRFYITHNAVCTIDGIYIGVSLFTGLEYWPVLLE